MLNKYNKYPVFYGLLIIFFMALMPILFFSLFIIYIIIYLIFFYKNKETINSPKYMSKIRKDIYMNSREWKNLKEIHKEINLGRCAKCNKKTNGELHHITYERLGNEKIDDVIFLCRKCHQKIHDEKGYDRKGYYPI